MSPIPASHGSPWPSAAAAARTEVHVKPSTGSNRNSGTSEADAFASAAEYARRVGNIEITAPVVMYIYGGAGAGGITVPAIGDGGSFTVRRVADASTIVATGTLTGVTVPVGNTPATLTDAGFDWASYPGRRVTATSGASAGASVYIARNVSSGVAEIVRAQSLDPSGTTNVVLEIGDDYQIEYMPSAVTVRFPHTITGAAPAGTTIARVIFWDVAFDDDPTVWMHVPNLGGVNAVAFYGCTMGQIDGTYTAVGCSFPPDMAWNSGEQSLVSCLVRGSPTIGRSAIATWSGDTFVSGGTGAHVAGKLTVAGPVRCCNATGDGITIDTGGSIVTAAGAVLGGVGNSGRGLCMRAGTMLRYGVGGLPTITATNGDWSIYGNTRSWGAIVFGSALFAVADGSAVGPVDGSGIIPFPVGFLPSVMIPPVAPGTTVKAQLVAIPVNGPGLIIPNSGSGQGVKFRCLGDLTYSGDVTIIVTVKLGGTEYFVFAEEIVTADKLDGELYAIGNASGTMISSGYGLWLEVAVTVDASASDPTPPMAITIYI